MLAAPAIVRAQSPIQLKATHWLPPVHQIHKELTRWSEDLARRSGNRVAITVLPAGQMGPPQRQFDLARTGVADIGYFLPGLTPGRFPMADLFQLPVPVQPRRPARQAAQGGRRVGDRHHRGRRSRQAGGIRGYENPLQHRQPLRQPVHVEGDGAQTRRPQRSARASQRPGRRRANRRVGRDAGRGRAGRSRRRDGEGHDRRHDLQLRGRARLSDRQRCQKGDGAELGRERVHAGDQPRKV